MKKHHAYPPAIRAFAFLLLVVLALSVSRLAAAETPSTGEITGRVTDANTKLALAGARLSVDGTTLETFTDQQGSYHLTTVPAGTPTLSVSYVGYPTQTVTATVVAGQTARRDIVFGEEIVQMSAFHISGAVTGSARAINEQRSSDALTDVVAADAIGALPNKNVAEALERVPGIEIARDKGEGRYVNIRGMDPIYIGISMNGIRMSTSEKGSREAALDTISSTMIAGIEVNKVNLPSMDSDNIGGSVNLKTRTGFDQTGTQLMISGGTNYSNQESQHGGFNGAINYADVFFHGKLGVAVDLSSDYRPFSDYTEPATGWQQNKVGTDPNLYWVPTSMDFRHYDAKRWRDALSASIDYKASDTTKLWVRFFTTNYTERNNQWLTTFPFGTSTYSAATNTSGTVSIKAGGLIKSEAQIANNKREQSAVAGLDSTMGQWSNHFTAAYTTGKYTRPTVTAAFANNAAMVVSYQFADAYHNNVAQVSGPAIDNPASYAFSTKSSYSNTTANMHEETVKDDVRNDFEIGGLPAYIQVGAEYRNKNASENTFKMGLNAIPFPLASNIIQAPDVQDPLGGFSSFRIAPAAVQTFYTNPASFSPTLTVSTTYGGAFQSLEDVAAGYIMGEVTIDRLKILIGGRVEDTDFHIDGWQYDTVSGAVAPVAYSKDYSNFLPAIVFTYEFDPRTIARASVTETLARPDYSTTIPGRTINDTALTVTQGNPQLPPLTATNYDASIEHYYAPLGLVSVGAFYKSISNFTYLSQAAGIDPSTGYLLQTYLTGPTAWIYGLEFDWRQRLSFLPAPFDGLGVLVNAMVGDSQATYPTRPGETLPFFGYAKKSGNAAITYDYRSLHLQVACNYHGKRMESGAAIGANATQDQYEDQYHTIDLGATYSFGPHWQVYLNGANLNNAPLKEYYGGTGSLQRIQTLELYGWSAESGVRWTY